MSQFVESEWIYDLECVTDDSTIGLSESGAPVEAGREDMLVDVSRLRAALIEFDQEIGETTAALTVLRNDSSTLDLLALQDVNGHKSIVLAGRVRPDDLEDGEQS